MEDFNEGSLSPCAMWERGLQEIWTLILAFVYWVWEDWELAGDITSIELWQKERKLNWEKAILMLTQGCGWACVYTGSDRGPESGSWHGAICKSWEGKGCLSSSKSATKKEQRALGRQLGGCHTYAIQCFNMKDNDSKKPFYNLTKDSPLEFQSNLFSHPAPSLPTSEV